MENRLRGEINQLIEELISGYDERSEAAALQLAAHGTHAVEPLRHLLDSADPDQRWWAIRTLAAIEDPTVPTILTTSLDDPSEQVQEAAALGLSHQPHPEAVLALVRMLESGSSLLRRLSGSALTKIGEEAVPPLIEVLENGSHPAKLEAVRALALIGDKRAIPALFAALQQDSALMEYWASEGLGNMGLGMSFFQT